MYDTRECPVCRKVDVGCGCVEEQRSKASRDTKLDRIQQKARQDARCRHAVSRGNARR